MSSLFEHKGFPTLGRGTAAVYSYKGKCSKYSLTTSHLEIVNSFTLTIHKESEFVPLVLFYFILFYFISEDLKIAVDQIQPIASF